MRLVPVKGDGYDHQRLYALMVFPEDALFREAYLRMLIQRQSMPDDPTLREFDVGESPRWAEMKEQAKRAVKSGTLAGYFLAGRAMLELHGIREPSNRKASQFGSTRSSSHRGAHRPSRAERAFAEAPFELVLER